MPSKNAKLTALFLEWAKQMDCPGSRWRSEFGRELRRVLQDWGNFKNAPRGKPGFQTQNS